MMYDEAKVEASLEVGAGVGIERRRVEEIIEETKMKIYKEQLNLVNKQLRRKNKQEYKKLLVKRSKRPQMMNLILVQALKSLLLETPGVVIT